MSEIIQTIKELAHKISEDYLLFNKDMNESIVELYQAGLIENEEILKRVCEHANQNVYLGLFNDPNTNKANITFTIADFKTIIPVIREGDQAMNELNTPPMDFRKNLSSTVKPDDENENENEDSEDENEGTEKKSDLQKQSELHTVIQYRDTLSNLLNKVSMMKCAEEKVAEESFTAMNKDARILVARGESIGDLSKIATRSVQEKGGCFEKVAQAYDMINKDLLDNNFNVNTEFTKLSSMKINHDSEILKPVNNFSMAILKIAGFEEMQSNLSKTLEAFDTVIKKEIKK